jgi:hypothetical protein
VTSWELLNIGLSIFGAYADYTSFEPEDPDPLEDLGDELEEFKEELMDFTGQMIMFTEKMDPDCKFPFDHINGHRCGDRSKIFKNYFRVRSRRSRER